MKALIDAGGDSEKLLEFNAVNGSRMRRAYALLVDHDSTTALLTFVVVAEASRALTTFFLTARVPACSLSSFLSCSLAHFC